MPRRVLILAATTGYQTRAFEETARSIGFEVVMGTDRCHVLDDPWGDQAVPVRFAEPEAGALTIARLQEPPDGVIAVGDKPTVLAAEVAARMGLRFHSREAAEICRNKFLARERFRAAGLLVPYYYRVPAEIDIAEAARSARFPCVLKPVGLSASRGVVRANDEYDFTEAFQRIRELVRGEGEASLLVESYIPGREFAVEGLVIDGRLKPLAIFDKPDPLEGPYFEETIYVTPSRESLVVQQELVATTQRAVTAVGLTNGPVHAEMRVNDEGVWMLEVAARPIGGLCANALRFGDGMPLEELLLRFAVGEDVSQLEREAGAAGVMMIPIPKSGIFHAASGVGTAAAVPRICRVSITAKEGQRILALPEGSSYLGFIFARAETPGQVETALRQAHEALEFEIMTELPALKPGS